MARRRAQILSIVFSTLILLGGRTSCTLVDPDSVYPTVAIPRFSVDRITSFEITESSGLVASERHPGVLWTHNDSGDRARLFAIDPSGRLLTEFAVHGATHVDWEDITLDREGNLYVGDFGNNDSDRRDLTIYRIPEPDPHAENPASFVEVDRVIRFRYADQLRYPDPDRLNFDAEALVWHDGQLGLFTKHRTDSKTRIYRIPIEPDHDGEIAIVASGELDLGGRVERRVGNTTAAALRGDGKLLALLTYGAILLYPPDEDLLPAGPIRRIETGWPRIGQAESVTFLADELIVGTEEGNLYRIANPLDPAWTILPPEPAPP